jgi:hypothetical protein
MKCQRNAVLSFEPFVAATESLLRLGLMKDGPRFTEDPSGRLACDALTRRLKSGLYSALLSLVK